MQNMNEIHTGHCIDILKTFPEKSINCCITSPPYWALRDYQTNPVTWDDGWQGELGLEPTPDLYIQHLCDIFDEVKNILKDDGTCWVNIGDTYGGSGLGTKGKNSIYKNDLSYLPKPPNNKIKQKCLLLIPFRFAVEMVNRGWIIRNVIIWQKPNCTPSSAKDRFTVDFEYLFFFSKNKKYYFEQQIEPFKESTYKRCKTGCNENKGTFYQGLSKENFEKIQNKILTGKLKGKNKRAIWNIATSNFKEAHFATYPPKLIETPIKAGCPEGGIVLDPFIGSGTTAVVAETLKRNWIGIDLNPSYTEIAEKRINDNRLKISNKPAS